MSKMMKTFPLPCGTAPNIPRWTLFFPVLKIVCLLTWRRVGGLDILSLTQVLSHTVYNRLCQLMKILEYIRSIPTNTRDCPKGAELYRGTLVASWTRTYCRLVYNRSNWLSKREQSAIGLNPTFNETSYLNRICMVVSMIYSKVTCQVHLN